MLTGTVKVGLKKDLITIKGNNKDNSIVIDANANDLADLVQGTDGTKIKYARKLVRAIERGADGFSGVSIDMKKGNDTVVIDGNGAAIEGDLYVDLGDGGDVFVAVDGAVAGNVMIENPDASAYVALANVEIEGDLTYVGSPSGEIFAMCDVFVDGDVDISTKKGHDTVIIATSEITDDLRVSLGRGDDLLAIVDSFVGDNTDVYGYTGHDGAVFDGNVWDPPSVSDVETVYTDVDDVPQDVVDAVTDKLADLFEALDDADIDVPPTLEGAAIKLDEIFNGGDDEEAL